MFLIARYCLLLWLSSGVLTAVAEVSPCNPKTPLESVYCQIQAKGEGAGLPTLYEFRKNPSATQALLLKRGAQKLGIPMPAAPRAKPKAATLVKDGPPEEQTSSKKKTGVRTVAEPTSDKRVAPSIVHKPATGDLTNCVLGNEIISCQQVLYRLQFNLPNKQLASGALTASNRLQFPPAPQDASQESSYLAQSYAIYIEKMLAIGLAAATLTYGKFDGIYKEVTRQQVDFGARFTRMYQFLQQDKLKQQAPKRFTQALPENLGQCFRLSASIIVCDNLGVNWIYRLVF